jgi:hypothetical protein
MRPPTVILTAVGIAFAATGCAKPSPVTEPPPPALVMPVTPPRVLAPLPVPPPEEVAAQPEHDREEPASNARQGRPVRPRAEKGEGGARPEPRPEEAAADPAVAVPEAKPAEPAPLRTPQTVNDAEAERRIREVLTRASRTLSQVNERALGSDARMQYQSARRFIDQADGALRASNYMFASYLADKAEVLARGLVGR